MWLSNFIFLKNIFFYKKNETISHLFIFFFFLALSWRDIQITTFNWLGCYFFFSIHFGRPFRHGLEPQMTTPNPHNDLNMIFSYFYFFNIWLLKKERDVKSPASSSNLNVGGILWSLDNLLFDSLTRPSWWYSCSSGGGSGGGVEQKRGKNKEKTMMDLSTVIEYHQIMAHLTSFFFLLDNFTLVPPPPPPIESVIYTPFSFLSFFK